MELCLSQTGEVTAGRPCVCVCGGGGLIETYKVGVNLEQGGDIIP